jgi:DNA-binding response OmpR family regulator
MKRVLIIDDDVSIRAMLKIILQGEGVSISTARNGEDGLRIVNEEHPNLVILDINMPGISGFQVCERIKSQMATREIPVIFHSVNSRIVDKEKGASLGAAGYLLKPVHPEELLKAVRSYL